MASSESTSLAQLAQEAYDQFVTNVRPRTDESFVKTRDDAPEWVDDLVRSAHDGGEEPRAMPAAPAACEAPALSPMPQHLRGQLSAWAESVCGPVERDLGVLADWACEVIDDEH